MDSNKGVTHLYQFYDCGRGMTTVWCGLLRHMPSEDNVSWEIEENVCPRCIKELEKCKRQNLYREIKKNSIEG